MKSRAFRVGLEHLESRETPSGFVSAMAATRHTLTFRGNGSGQVTSMNTLSNGIQLAANLSGSAVNYGSFTGAGTAFIGLKGTGSGTAELVAADGAVVDIRFSGKVKLPKAGAGTTTGNFNFTVLRGTNEFAGATGSGKINGSVNLTTGQMVYTFNGKVRV